MSGNVEKNGPLNGKIVIPYGVFQLKANYKDGKLTGSASTIDGRQAYLNGKVGNLDIRVIPLNGRGDYDPGARLLYTIVQRPIIIPVGDVPVPIGDAKLQGDFQVSPEKATIGVGVAESFSIPSFKKGASGIKLELNAGVKFELQVPDIFKN